jgi:hypothetical protein
MTKEEYNSLPRFKREEHLYAHNNLFFENEVFEVHTLDCNIRYLKITQNFYNSILVLQECKPDGELITRFPVRMEAQIGNVISLIDEEGLWRIYKPAVGRAVSASN